MITCSSVMPSGASSLLGDDDPKAHWDHDWLRFLSDAIDDDDKKVCSLQVCQFCCVMLLPHHRSRLGVQRNRLMATRLLVPRKFTDR